MSPRISWSEKCIVGIGLKRQVALDSGVLAIAEHEGNNITTDVNKILLSGKVDKGDIISFSLIMYQHSNKNTCMHKKPRVL